MARQGTPNGGLDEITERVYVNGADLTLVCYTNAQDSLSAATVAADLTQPTQANGYVPIVLNGTWSTTNGVVTYEHPAGVNTDLFGNPAWFPSAAWSDTVTGVAMIYGSRVVHFMDLRDGAGDPTTWVYQAGQAQRWPVDVATLAS